MRSSLFSLLPLVPLASAFNSYRSPLTDCLNDANVAILLSNSNGWSDAIEPFNLRFSPAPTIVAIPYNEADVAAAVTCADRAGVKVTVRGGGHSYGAYALAGTVVIDMVQFQQVSMDTTTNIVSVGAGMRLGNLANSLFVDHGERALPHGTCASVGVGGHATLGGFGLSSRLWGLAVDTITGFEVVLANGTCESVTASSNKDLFWALRGAGAGFAIITTFHFQTVAAPPNNIFWAYTYTFPTPSASTDAFMFASSWAMDAPKELGYGIVLSPGGFVIRGVYFGVHADFDPLIAPLLAGMKTLHGGVDPTANVQLLGWIASLELLADGPLVLPPQGDGAHDTFYVKSIETHQHTPLSRNAMLSFFVYVANAPVPAGSDWFIIINLYGGGDSVITSFPPSTDPSSTSSYAGRDTAYVWQLYGNMANLSPPFNGAIITYISGMVSALGSEAAGLPGYAPYPDTEFTREEAQARYWGDGAPRLRAIKADVDPKGTVYSPQGF